jgi:pyruvate dehydrogenase E2 component (dihydrolipoamide acetyltransferase)
MRRHTDPLGWDATFRGSSEFGSGDSAQRIEALGSAMGAGKALPAPSGMGSETRGAPDDLLRGPSIREAVPGRDPDPTRAALLGTVFVEVDMTDAVAFREDVAEGWEKSYGVRLSLNHLVLKATATALKDQPALNPRRNGHSPRTWEQINLGVSIFVNDGVVTPVLRDADSLSLVEIASQVARFYERAEESRLSESELMGAIVTVTNLGKYGVDGMALAADPPGTVVVLGLGRCVRKPVVMDEELKFRWLMVLSLSFDGRAMDGAKASKFLSLVKDILERPTLLIR